MKKPGGLVSLRSGSPQAGPADKEAGMKARLPVIGVFCLIALGCASTHVEQPKIPITTPSDEARTH